MTKTLYAKKGKILNAQKMERLMIQIIDFKEQENKCHSEKERYIRYVKRARNKILEEERNSKRRKKEKRRVEKGKKFCERKQQIEEDAWN